MNINDRCSEWKLVCRTTHLANCDCVLIVHNDELPAQISDTLLFHKEGMIVQSFLHIQYNNAPFQ